MKVKIKLQKKAYIKLLLYIAKIEIHYCFLLNNIDVINIRSMCLDALMKHERWRHDKEYNRSIKTNIISIDINHFNCLYKMYDQLKLEGIDNYETNLLFIIVQQVNPQIDLKIRMLNQNF